MNKIPNRQAICEVLMKHAKTDKDIVVLCSDSRGSASLTPFANAYPEQFVEMGIAEQDQRFCRSCKMRQESICGISGVLPFYKKL